MQALSSHPLGIRFWFWCYRHDLTDTMRKSKSTYMRLCMYRSIRLYQQLRGWGIPHRVSSTLAWARVFLMYAAYHQDYKTEKELQRERANNPGVHTRPDNSRARTNYRPTRPGHSLTSKRAGSRGAVTTPLPNTGAGVPHVRGTDASRSGYLADGSVQHIHEHEGSTPSGRLVAIGHRRVVPASSFDPARHRMSHSTQPM